MAENSRGGIALYLAVAMFAVAILCGVLVDAARAGAARNHAARALDLASLSALAAYDTMLRQDYGIFAVSSRELLGGAVEDYVLQNLSISRSGGLLGDLIHRTGLFAPRDAINAQLYDFRVDDLLVEPMMPLTDVDVLDRQILEFMKFRAPVALLGGVINKLRAASETQKLSEPLSKKMDLDKSLAKLGKEQLTLSNLLGVIGGGGGGGSGGGAAVATVRGFASDDFRAVSAPRIAELYDSYVKQKQFITEVTRSTAKNNEPAPDLRFERQDMGDTLRELQNEWNATKNKLLAYKTANENALKSVRKIADESGKLLPRFDLFDASLEDTKRSIEEGRAAYASELGGGSSEGGSGETGSAEGGSGEAGSIEGGSSEGGSGEVGTEPNEADPYAYMEPADEIIRELEDSSASGRESLLGSERADEIARLLQANVAMLDAAYEEYKRIEKKLLSYNPDEVALGRDAIVKAIDSPMPGYNVNIPYDIGRGAAQGSYVDPRQLAMDTAATLADDTGLKSRDLTRDLGIRMGDLPSRNLTTGNGSDDAGAGTGAGDWGGDYGDDPGKALGAEMDLYNESSDFATGKLGMLSKLGDLASFVASGSRNHLYRAEYALCAFKNAVKEPYPWALGVLGKRGSFYQAEIEYLLHGKSNQSTNVAITKVQLFGLRVPLNLIHVYSDPKKVELSTTMATCAIGEVFPPLIPVVQALIATAWSAIEAYRDVKDLMGGEKVPFVKLIGDWKTEIGISGGGGGKKTPEVLKFSYLDYMRIFLIFARRDKLAGRALDLFEINAIYEGRDFVAAEMYCGVKAQLDASFNYLFVASSLMPDSMRSSRNRGMVRVTAERDLF